MVKKQFDLEDAIDILDARLTGEINLLVQKLYKKYLKNSGIVIPPLYSIRHITKNIEILAYYKQNQVWVDEDKWKWMKLVWPPKVGRGLVGDINIPVSPKVFYQFLNALKKEVGIKFTVAQR